jgi:hypothetical protein
LGRLELLHLQLVALRLLTVLLFYMLTAAVLEAEAVVAVPLGLAAEMVAQVGRRLMAVRLAVRVAMLVMAATVHLIIVVLEPAMQVRAAAAAAVALRALTNPKLVAEA